jgi:hypothetical protein
MLSKWFRFPSLKPLRMKAFRWSPAVMLMWAKNGNRIAQKRRRVPNAFNGADRVRKKPL